LSSAARISASWDVLGPTGIGNSDISFNSSPLTLDP
jgi:hypothetical protein